MARSRHMVLHDASWLQLQRRQGETLRRAVERALREAITTGVLRPGVVLPSSRALANHLGVSRGVTTEAYSQLEAQGFVINRTKAPPVVAEVGSLHRTSAARETTRTRPRYDMSPTTPDVSIFPRRQWASALLDVLRHSPAITLDYGEARGLRQLREALADRLGRTRGVRADPEQIIIVQGVGQGITVLSRVLAARHRNRVAVEDPCLDSQRQRIREHGHTVVGQPVDIHGLTLDGLRADAVVVTPAHQFPTGAVLSGSRRRQLLRWAGERNALIIEDDYDAEFRYDRQPIRALQGLDPERVVYLGTTSKTLAPALRLGWLVVPSTMMDEAIRIKHLLDVLSPVIDQLALARFIDRGDYDRHIRRARGIYTKRRDHLLTALHRHLPALHIEGVAAGMHILLRLPHGVTGEHIAAAAARDGVAVTPLSTYQLTHSADDGLVIGYGRLRDDDVNDAVEALAEALDS